ncbi:MAG: hypothetical protein ABI541_02755, partial [Betaproteobacteria bacterium]
FNPTRRPAPPATASSEGEKKVQSGQFVLTGTTLAGDRSIAFLKEVAGGKARTVRQGDKINGMLVAEVLPDRVRFTQGGESEELMLKVSPGPKTTVAAAPPAAQAVPPRRAGAAARRAAAAAGEGQQPGAPPQTGRSARAAAKAAAEAANPGHTGANAPPAGNTPTDAWGQVYQRMQRGNAHTK